MKLLRFGELGQERPGMLDGDGKIRDLSSVVRDIEGQFLSPESLASLERIDWNSLPVVQGNSRLGPPIAAIRQFVAIGLNYRKHAAESGMATPVEPIVFFKGVGSICGPRDDVVMAPASSSTDWEVELGVVIGTTARQVSSDDALDHVAGYCLANDVSERDWQLNRGGQWSKGKSFDTYGPLGPWLVTKSEIPDPQAIPLTLSVNGVCRQQSNTADQIFKVAEVIAYLSSFMTLFPGDVIITGTPEGVAMGMKPPQYLRPGDLIEVDGGPLGKQRSMVRS